MRDFKETKLQLAELLERRGLELNDYECTLDSAVEYINQTDDYTPQEWVQDTLQNYPECFKR